MNKKLRMTVDILMVVLLPMLMAYSLIGEKFHEIAGTHLVAPLKKLAKKSRASFSVLTAALGLVSAYGVFAFIRRGFPGYMSGRTAFALFDLSEPKAVFFGDYLAIMVLFMMIGCVIIYALSKNKKSA